MEMEPFISDLNFFKLSATLLDIMTRKVAISPSSRIPYRLSSAVPLHCSIAGEARVVVTRTTHARSIAAVWTLWTLWTLGSRGGPL